MENRRSNLEWLDREAAVAQQQVDRYPNQLKKLFKAEIRENVASSYTETLEDDASESNDSDGLHE